jgi:nitroimidazol reductase NimA-like FMN-containing flavoprotein (pyridoxamine 5'-phosphate oxidase superfamily)
MVDEIHPDQVPVTGRTVVHRLPGRGTHDRRLIEAILDEAFICHVGLVIDGQPYVIPMNYGRGGDRIYLHGHRESRMLRHLAAGAEVCVSVTVLDGLVLARSACEHSVNYRSVVLFGVAHLVTDEAERLEALRCITDHFVPGRWAEAREPGAHELREVVVVSIPVDEASAKVRDEPPKDGEGAGSGPWVGVIPIQLVAGTPVASPSVPPGILPPLFDRERRARPG